MRVFIGDQSVVITKVLLCTLRRRTRVFAVVSGSSVNSVFEVRPRRACGLVVCTGLESPRSSSVNSPCRCCGTE